MKLIVTQVSSLIASCDQPLPLSAVKILVPALVMGTKEKNSMVKSSSEYALISVLKLREGDAVLKVKFKWLSMKSWNTVKTSFDYYTFYSIMISAKCFIPVSY